MSSIMSQSSLATETRSGRTEAAALDELTLQVENEITPAVRDHVRAAATAFLQLGPAAAGLCVCTFVQAT